MEWTDDAVVLGVKKHGETSVIAELMTRERGRHLGLVQGGRSRTLRPLLQPGNSVRAVWRARLEDHLGQFKLESTGARAAKLMETPHGVYALQTIAAHLRLLPERDAHPALFAMLNIVLDNLTAPDIAGELFVRFELAILDELGFGLDLTQCAATGRRRDLIYVSPKSGRAVNREAGAPYAERMLPLPPFLLVANPLEVESASLATIEDGFRLTGFFLDRHVFGPRAIDCPPERDGLIRAVRRAMEKEEREGPTL
ncbi:DNA repair protein RecO [Pseudahrensia aquimaris]|uniref:DNA repair protein RecO n=1 Tax=Pseudahrensia aquimaris TaxID=744461 RepID=A0ABW3FEQ6_9HYPH